jgi:hypothetical protein
MLGSGSISNLEPINGEHETRQRFRFSTSATRYSPLKIRPPPPISAILARAPCPAPFVRHPSTMNSPRDLRPFVPRRLRCLVALLPRCLQPLVRPVIRPLASWRVLCAELLPLNFKSLKTDPNNHETVETLEPARPKTQSRGRQSGRTDRGPSGAKAAALIRRMYETRHYSGFKKGRLPGEGEPPGEPRLGRSLALPRDAGALLKSVTLYH